MTMKVNMIISYQKEKIMMNTSSHMINNSKTKMIILRAKRIIIIARVMEAIMC